MQRQSLTASHQQTNAQSDPDPQYLGKTPQSLLLIMLS